MTDLTTFKNETFGEVRTVMRDGEPWFIATDVCKSLDIEETGKATSRLDSDELTRIKIVSGGQHRDVIAVNEPGLYTLVLGSRKPEAKAFKRWITHEVIPTIRKHGAYATDEFIERSVQDPDYALAILTALKEERNKTKTLEAENAKKTVELAIAQPKVEYFNELVDRNLLTNFRITAKELGIKEKPFIKFLIDHKYLYRDPGGKLLPKADKNDGLFEIKECYNEKTDWRGTQTLITPKGRETFRLLCQGV